MLPIIGMLTVLVAMFLAAQKQTMASAFVALTGFVLFFIGMN